MAVRVQEIKDPRQRELFERALSRDLGKGNGPTVQPDAPHDHRPLPDTQPQRHKAPTLGPAAQGKAGGLHRVTVRFVGYRVRPLDPDNFAGSVKDLLDGLRHAGLLHGDEPWRIRLETEQEKVPHYEDEKTVIEIYD